MDSMIFNDNVAAAFGCRGRQQLLEGGEGKSIRVGSCVFKPIENEARYTWACDLLLRLRPGDYRIHQPRRTETGGFVYNGWGASRYEMGEPAAGRWEEKLRVCRSFHAELDQLQISSMPPGDDPWSQAQEITWQRGSLPDTVDSEIAAFIERLFDGYETMPRPDRIIHSDLCGNILFAANELPCVIDFSPAHGSPQYAESILIADAIAWEKAPLALVDELRYAKGFRQLLLRAINFRLIAAALFRPDCVNRFLEEYRCFEGMIKLFLADEKEK
jgi:hypothetical protein